MSLIMVSPLPTLPRSSPPPHPYNYMTYFLFCRKQADKSELFKKKRNHKKRAPKAYLVYEQPKAKSMKTQNIRP